MDHTVEVASQEVTITSVSDASYIPFVQRPPFREFSANPITPAGRIAKRALDLLIAVPSLATLSPILAILAVAVKSDSKGPAFYKSIRVGQSGKEFTCYKFR